MENSFFTSSDIKNVKYPIINGIPIIINEDKSLFSIKDFTNNMNLHYNLNINSIILLNRGCMMGLEEQIRSDIENNPIPNNSGMTIQHIQNNMI